MNQITLPELAGAVPTHIKSRVDQTLVDHINGLISDPEMAEIYKDNLISYTNVLEKGKFKLSAYVDAVRYVSYKCLGETNIKAYMEAFPDKYSTWKANGVDDDTISKYVHSYNWGKLVQMIWQQAMTPFLLLNQATRQKALNIQLQLAETSKSDTVRTMAANSILTHLKPPEENNHELLVTVQESSALTDLREVVKRMADTQHRQMVAGTHTARDVAHQGVIVDGEFTDE